MPGETPDDADPKGRSQRRWLLWTGIGLGLVVLLSGTGFAVRQLTRHDVPPKTTTGATAGTTSSANAPATYDRATSAGLTHGQCTGEGPVTITTPMPLAQVSTILPYGLMVGGHVTPVDHQYYNGLDPKALRDTYDVVAPADGAIVEITHRGSRTNTPSHSVNVPSSDEYRIVFAHTCSFLTYVDLVTSIDDSIKPALPAGWSPENSRDIAIPVKKGQVIGHIGGQTLDFAVWDLSRPLKGFIVPLAYANAEPWKLYTAPTTDYLDDKVKAGAVAKYLRSTDPIDGRIDDDQEGRLIGSWFLEGTNGYLGGEQPGGRPGYWRGHLSFAPDHLDPATVTISTGTFSQDFWVNGGANDPGGSDDSSAAQFWVRGNTPDPAAVDAGTGPVTYELRQNGAYLSGDGARWDGWSPAKGLKASPNTQTMGVVLVQLLDTHKLRVEFFPGRSAAQVTGFGSTARIYTRGDDAHAPPPTNTP